MTDPTLDEEAKALGRRLKAARELAQLPQDAVAPVIDIPRSAISDIERGLRQVGALELGRFAGLYETTVERLLYGEQNPTVAPWSTGALYRDGRWQRMPKLAASLLERFPDAYERDGLEAIDIGEGATDAGVPHLGVWLRVDEYILRDLPMFEVQLVAGSLRVHVYAQAHAEVLHLLRELSPIVKDLHLANLAAQLGEADRTIEPAVAILKAAER